VAGCVGLASEHASTIASAGKSISLRMGTPPWLVFGKLG
jgi:hypothetical protein